MIQADPAIEVRGICRSFGDFQALQPLDLDVQGGAVTGLLGPNGSGKSTFLRILVGLVRPDSGRAQVAGVELAGDGTAIRKRCSYSPGEIALYKEMSGDEHLRWLLRGRGRAALKRGRQIAAELELPLAQRVQGYSHGMKRQLLFAAAMAPRVPVRILDEPTEGLDPSKRSALLEILHRDAADGSTILLSSHHLGEVEFVCDRILFLDRGSLLSDQTPEELRSRARRLLHISWPPDTDPSALSTALAQAGEGLLENQPTLARGEAQVLLREPSPGPFLTRLFAQDSIPPPATIDYGRPSLKDLYRELYGVEGL